MSRVQQTSIELRHIFLALPVSYGILLQHLEFPRHIDMTPHPTSWLWFLKKDKQVVQIRIQVSHVEAVPVLVDFDRPY